jgi:hypothetical protein
MESSRQPISICAVVDVVGALATGVLSGNLYLFDTTSAPGGASETLRTRVERGDQLHWTVFALECEAYAAIDGIVIDPKLCEVERKTYPGTDVSYWLGTVKRDVGMVPYHIQLRLGNRAEPMTTSATPFLVGDHHTKSQPPVVSVPATSGESKQNPGQLNSVQLNIVSVVDVERASVSGSLQDAVYMMDNSVGSDGRGTAHLQTACKQGQVLNWIIYPMVSEKRRDGTWPPMPRINNIVFLDDEEGEEDDVSEFKVCTDFKIFGMPDLTRSRYTPVYQYWAGTVLSTLKPGVYRYRFVLELEQDGSKEKLYLNTLERPSIRVQSIE